MSAESRGIIEEFAGNPLLGDASEDELILLDSPYRRPTRIFDNRFIDFDRPLAKEDLASNSSLSTHRLLLNIYESDMLFLPKDGSPAALASMRKFYGYEHSLRAEKARSILERKAFAFLDEDVEGRRQSARCHFGDESVADFIDITHAIDDVDGRNVDQQRRNDSR